MTKGERSTFTDINESDIKLIYHIKMSNTIDSMIINSSITVVCTFGKKHEGYVRVSSILSRNSYSCPLGSVHRTECRKANSARILYMTP